MSVRAGDPVCVVLSGGGSLAVNELGAFAALSARNSIQAAAGTSAGSIVAAAWGCGLSVADSLAIFKESFADGVLDPSPRAWPRFGACLGDRAHAILRRALPCKMSQMKRDVRIVTCSLWSRKPVLVTPRTHPDVMVADAVRCSISIPGLFAAQRLEPGNATLYVDGGLAKNFAMDALDDVPVGTVGIRVRGTGADDIEPVRPWDFMAFGKAIAELLFFASDNAHDSEKAGAVVMPIETNDDPFDFKMSGDEVQRRYTDGYMKARRWLYGVRDVG